MAIKAMVRQNFSGGWSIGKKVGIKNSQAYTQAFDFRKSPSQMSVLPGLSREDNGVVKDLIQDEVMTPDGTIYAIGDAGAFYKRTTTGVWSKEADVGHGTFGLDYRKDTDSIYIPTRKSVSLYNNVSGANGSPAIYMNYYGASFSTLDNTSTVGFFCAAYQTGSSQSYTPPTSILEDQNDIRYFQSDIEPLNQISVFVKIKGSGDWTVTLHDGNNNVLGTSTVSNGNLVNNTWNNFPFTSAPNGQVRIYVAPNARTYHIHVTSSVADGKLSTSTNNSLNTCDLEVWADRLVMPDNGMHPMDRFQQYEIFANANYVSIWEPLNGIFPVTNTSAEDDVTEVNTEWLRHRLVFPMEYNTCGLAHTNEYEVIALEQPSTSTTSTPQEGLIAFWDGVSPTYNYFLTIPEGSPYGLHTYKNIVYYYAGGDWYSLTSPTTLPVKIWSMPDSDTEFSGSNTPIIIYPHAATVRRGIQLMAYPCMTANSDINFGVYSWGSVDKNFPESFGYNYLISTGTQNYTTLNNLTIGMVKNFGDVLHVSWRDSSSEGGYGLDVVTNASKPAPLAIWQDLVFDNGYVGKSKTAGFMDCYFYLPDGATLQMAYMIDNNVFIEDSNIYTSTDLWQGQENYARFQINEGNLGRFYEIQTQITLTCDSTVTQPPAIRMVSLVFNDNADESLS